jgi:hypothetical protein
MRRCLVLLAAFGVLAALLTQPYANLALGVVSAQSAQGQTNRTNGLLHQQERRDARQKQ